MPYIFLDESGDLGFNFKKKGTSKFFVITLLFAGDKRPIEKVVSKTHSELKKKHKKRGGVLHCYQEKPVIRQKLLKRLAERDCVVMTIYLNKHKVYTRLQNEKIFFITMLSTYYLIGFAPERLLMPSNRLF